MKFTLADEMLIHHNMRIGLLLQMEAKLSQILGTRLDCDQRPKIHTSLKARSTDIKMVSFFIAFGKAFDYVNRECVCSAFCNRENAALKS